MPLETAEKQLERLSARNLLDVRIAESLIYRYRPGAEWLARLVDEAFRAYEADRRAVRNLVSGRSRG